MNNQRSHTPTTTTKLEKKYENVSLPPLMAVFFLFYFYCLFSILFWKLLVVFPPLFIVVAFNINLLWLVVVQLSLVLDLCGCWRVSSSSHSSSLSSYSSPYSNFVVWRVLPDARKKHKVNSFGNSSVNSKKTKKKT